MDQQNYGRVISSGGWFESSFIRTPKSNPILEYKPDFMPSVVDSPLFQPDGDEKVVDYLELLQIPPGTSTPDSQKIISGIEGNIKSTYVQNIQILKMAEAIILDGQTWDAYNELKQRYGTRQSKWVEMKIEKDRQQREGNRKLNEYNREVQKGIEHDNALKAENEELNNRCYWYQRFEAASEKEILDEKRKISEAAQWTLQKLEKAVKAWLEAVQFEKVARAEFLEALKAGSEEAILHAKAIHKSSLKSTRSAQEHKDTIYELFFKIGELQSNQTKEGLASIYQTMLNNDNFPSSFSREREELEESNHQEYYQRMKATALKEPDRAAELQNWFRRDRSSSSECRPPIPWYDPGGISAKMKNEVRKEMELVEKKEAEKEREEAAKAKIQSNKERAAKARAENRVKRVAATEAERLSVEAIEKERKEKERIEKQETIEKERKEKERIEKQETIEKERKEKERIEKREATKARKAAEKELASKKRAEKKAAKAAKKDQEKKTAAKKDREEKAKRQTRAASVQSVGGRNTRATSAPPVAGRKTRAASTQPVGVRKTRSSSKRPSPSSADQERVAEQVLEAVEEGSEDIEVVDVVKREPSLSPV